MKDDGATAEPETSGGRIIKRPRLTRLLDNANSRILVLVGPAGYGKTTLAREWTSARHAAWLTATAAKADVASLALALRQTVASFIPDFALSLEEQLRIGPRPERDAALLGDSLGSQIIEWDPTWSLVIDDYHTLVDAVGVEAFFEAFAMTSPARILIASRVRPSWVTARRLVYGDVRELGQQALAMTDEEASEVLKQRSAAAIPGLLALADGWPALLGLAAQAPLVDVPEAMIAASFYEFLAEELYSVASASVKDDLVLLSLAPTITEATASVVLGEKRARRTLAETVRLGFIQRDRGSTYSMHSLISDFLRRRAGDERAIDLAVARLGEFLFDRSDFDDLYILARTFSGDVTLRELTNLVIRDVLERNEIGALHRWLNHAVAIRLETPEVDLAAAESAFREGRYQQSELLAERSSAQFDTRARLRSRALFRAGLSAHHSNQTEKALEYHGRALEAAIDESDRLQALWGTFTAALELERDPTDLLRQLEDAASRSPLYRIRLANARLALAYRVGGLATAVEDADASLALLDRIDDPMVASAFLNAYALALVLSARYKSALNTIGREIDVIDEFRLNFAVPHALALKVAALAGRRYFADAHHVLNQARKAAERSGDSFSLANLQVQRARLHLFQGDLEGAAHYASRARIPTALRAVEGERLTTQSLACAAAGDVEAARRLVDTSRRVTTSIETREWAAWTTVLVVAREKPDAFAEIAHDTFEASCSSGCLHSVVCAYRSFPQLLDALLFDDSLRVRIEDLVKHSRDETLGRRAGLDLRHDALGNLSPRETEVFQLLGEGLSNREIARRLFISEVTLAASRHFSSGRAGTRALNGPA